MTGQDQKVAEGGTAIQAAGSVTINTGITPDQMNQIMVGLAKQISLYLADAEKLADERLTRFRQEILEEFAKPGRANPEAFKDPDFQYLINRAQHAYARAGDKKVGDTLVKMIAERSQCKSRDRLSLVMNQAIDTVAVLTDNEFAELALSFLITQTANRGIRDLNTFSWYFTKITSPLLDDISTEQSSYTYLVAQQCASLNPISRIQLDHVFRTHYGGIFSDGFTLPDLKTQLGNDEERFNKLSSHLKLIPCPSDLGKFQFDVLNGEQLEQQLQSASVEDQTRNALTGLYSRTLWSLPRMIEKLKPTLPDFERFAKLWSETPLSQMMLTALGTAIGHANVRRIDPLIAADLSIWIK